MPTDEAFGHVVDRVERKYFRPALLTAAKRDPGRALRVLLGRCRAGGPDSTADVLAVLLRNHVLAYPQAVADALPALDAPDRARVEAILASVAPPAPTPVAASSGAATPGAATPAGGTPTVLAGPPRGANGSPTRGICIR